MRKLKKILRIVNDFSFEVLIMMTVMWGMYLAIALTIEVPIIGIPILVLCILINLWNRKKKKDVNQP